MSNQPVEIVNQLQNPNHPWGKYTSQFLTPQGIFLLGVLLFVFFQDKLSGRKKGKLATSYFGNSREIAKAKKKAFQQIKSPKCDSTCLYIGKHKFKPNPKVKTPPTQKEESGAVTLYVPDVQRGTAVIGAPGSGKSFSAINPMIYSAIDQGFPIVLYDFKYPSQAKVASYAKKKGYDVHIFAPGFPESEVCNPIDFLRDETDGETARQMATVINKNFKLNATDSAARKSKNCQSCFRINRCLDQTQVTYSIEEVQQKKVAVRIGEQILTPPQISARVLRKLKEDAEAVLGKIISQAVITDLLTV